MKEVQEQGLEHSSSTALESNVPRFSALFLEASVRSMYIYQAIVFQINAKDMTASNISTI